MVRSVTIVGTGEEVLNREEKPIRKCSFAYGKT
jgi:hypothetical protein